MASICGIGQRLRSASTLVHRCKAAMSHVNSVRGCSNRLSYYGIASYSGTTTRYAQSNRFLNEKVRWGRALFATTPEASATAANDPSPLLPSYFSCQKCLLKIAQEPVITTCGHVFCWPCLYMSISGGLGLLRGECPTCESAVDLFRPTRSVIPINECTCANRSYSMSVPPRPTGRRHPNLDHTFPYYAMKVTEDTTHSIEQASEWIVYTFNIAMEDIGDITLKIEEMMKQRKNFHSREQPNNSIGSSFSCSTTCTAVGDKSSAESSNTGSDRKSNALSFPNNLQHEFELHVNEWFSSVYHGSVKYFLAFENLTDRVNRTLFYMCSSLIESHSPLCYDIFSSECKFPNNHVYAPARRRSTWSDSGETPVSKGLAYASGSHDKAEKEAINGDNPLAVELGEKMKQDTSEMILEFENLMNQLHLKIDELNGCISQYSEFIEEDMKCLLLALLEGKNWVTAPDIPDILLNEDAYKKLAKLNEGWIEAAGRDITHALGSRSGEDDMDSRNETVISSAPSSLLTGSDSLSPIQPSSFLYCNVCGRAEDNIKEPVVTYCGHLYCWHCLRDATASNSEPIDQKCDAVSCTVCKTKLVSACCDVGNGMITVIPVCGKTKSIDDTCHSDDISSRPLAKKYPINIINKNIEVLCLAAEEMKRLKHLLQTAVENNKSTFDSIQQETKKAMERLRPSIAEPDE